LIHGHPSKAQREVCLGRQAGVELVHIEYYVPHHPLAFQKIDLDLLLVIVGHILLQEGLECLGEPGVHRASRGRVQRERWRRILVSNPARVQLLRRSTGDVMKKVLLKSACYSFALAICVICVGGEGGQT
jgi:hypothetical protein